MAVLHYFTGNFTLLQTLDFFARILIACICGAVIGIERSKRFKEAGIRTHIIVSGAAAMIMIVSKYGFSDLSDAAGVFFPGTRGADPARIAAQVVSGISFLGAGVIFRNGSTVKGLTTAAGIWATAGIGLACGAGMHAIGIFATIIIVSSQFIMHRFTVGADAYETFNMKFIVKNNSDGQFILDQIEAWKGQVVQNRVAHLENGRVEYEYTVKLQKFVTAAEFNEFLHEHEELLTGSSTPIK